MIKPLAAPAARAGSPEIRPYADASEGASPIWKAVLAGLAVDLGCSVLLSLVLAIGVAIFMATSDLPREEMLATYLRIAFNPLVYVPVLLIGLAMSCLGGYVCARMAGGAALRAGITLAVLTVVLGLLFAGDALIPAWVHGLLVVLTAAAVMLGVRLGSGRRI